MLSLAAILTIVPRKLGALLGTFYVVAWHNGDTLAIRAFLRLLTLVTVDCTDVVMLFPPLLSVTMVRRTGAIWFLLV